MNKASRTISAIITLAVVVLLFIYATQKSQTPVPSMETSSSTASTTETQSAASSSSPTSPAAPSATRKTTPVLTRDQAYKTYSQKGLYVQLIDCVGYPSYLIMPQGTKFMLENKSNYAAFIVIKSQYFTIPAKDFTIISAKDLGFYNITCNGKNAVQLQIHS